MSEGWSGSAAGTPASPGPTPPRSPGHPTGQQGGPPPFPAGGVSAPPRPAAVVSPGGRRRARLVIKRVDPWSVLKFSLVFSLCLVIVLVVAVMALYFALDTLGVFDSLNETLLGLTQSGTGEDATGGVTVVFSAGKVLLASVVVGLINVVIITAISTLGAFLYNLCGDIVGGVEVTLAERE
ncbi:MAG TPA: DUF3566 domain-containing protein [Mycobacteriales bacterium]|nr:DUF3566 domain-containing protein [Mycobacteriales bacterium]